MARSGSTALRGLPDFVPSPAHGGKTRAEPACRQGANPLGGGGPWDEPWGLARAGTGRAEPGTCWHKGPNAPAMGQDLFPWCKTGGGSLEDGEQQGCCRGMQSGSLSMGLGCQVFAVLPSVPCFPNRVDPLMDICAPSGTTAPRRSPRDLMVQGVQMRSLTPAGVEPCAAGAPWQEQPLLTASGKQSHRQEALLR